ncbi:hypothetical protein E3N88_18744 [Mikania micrantha]|uniref:Uncharacterized protein n=1 Tax=Mikania micrantha TaxID=192012 RepID=A0A5N6NNZ8_9ASTR|nr:hypothetical protein E3N88_18744 [Mikania micrantha]
MQYSSEVCHQLETNDDFLADTAFLDEIDNDAFVGIGLTAFEEPQTHLIQQQKMWGDAGVATEAYIDKLLKSIVPPLFERGIR